MRLILVLFCACFLVACAGSPGISEPTTDSGARNVPEGTYSVMRTERGTYVYFTPRGLVDENGFRVNLDGSPATGAINSNSPNGF